MTRKEKLALTMKELEMELEQKYIKSGFVPTGFDNCKWDKMQELIRDMFETEYNSEIPANYKNDFRFLAMRELNLKYENLGSWDL